MKGYNVFNKGYWDLVRHYLEKSLDEDKARRTKGDDADSDGDDESSSSDEN